MAKRRHGLRKSTSEMDKNYDQAVRKKLKKPDWSAAWFWQTVRRWPCPLTDVEVEMISMGRK